MISNAIKLLNRLGKLTTNQGVARSNRAGCTSNFKDLRRSVGPFFVGRGFLKRRAGLLWNIWIGVQSGWTYQRA